MYKNIMKDLELLGKKFGKLKVLAKSKRDYLSKDGRRTTGWIVKCGCGKIKRIRGASLTKPVKSTKSCGTCSRIRTKPGESAKWWLFLATQNSAKRRNLTFTLSLEEFLRITGSPCKYCGIKWSSDYPKNAKHINCKNLKGQWRLNGIYKHNGIDRLDSAIGYVSDNCVPCCWTCNIAKARLTEKEFKDWIKRVYFNLFQKDEKLYTALHL